MEIEDVRSGLSMASRTLGGSAVGLGLILLFPLARAADTAGGGSRKSNGDAGRPVYVDSVAAVVNGEVITMSDILRESARLELEIRKRIKDPAKANRQIMALRRRVAERLVERDLLYAEFKSLGVDVPHEAIQDRINRIIRDEAGGDRGLFEKQLEREGLTMRDFEKRISRDIAVELLTRERIRRMVHVAPEEVSAYYRRHRAEFTRPAQVHLQILFLKKDGKYAGRLDAVAQDVQGKLRRGADFAALAKRYSEQSGVDLGWLDLNQMRADFRRAIAGVKVGAVSAPVHTPEGVFLLRVAGRRGGEVAPLTDELYRSIERKLRAKEEEKRYKSFIAELRRKYPVRQYF